MKVAVSLSALLLGASTLTASTALARDDDRDGPGRSRDAGDYRGGRDFDRTGGYGYGHQWDPRNDRLVIVRERAPRVIRVYDWNSPDPAYGGYYADRYYRSGYRPIRVTRYTRIYRGQDDRYYCRRSDGTTGLIVGAAVGGLLGDRLDRGRSSILGAVLGASAGGLIGRELDGGGVSCR